MGLSPDPSNLEYLDYRTQQPVHSPQPPSRIVNMTTISSKVYIYLVPIMYVGLYFTFM